MSDRSDRAYAAIMKDRERIEQAFGVEKLAKLRTQVCRRCVRWSGGVMEDEDGLHRGYCTENLQPLTTDGEQCPYFEQRHD